MRIGVFGGTFDPPHNGHVIAASDAYEALALDRIAFVPNAAQPLKPDGAVAPAPDRLEMVRRLCHGDARFVADSLEIDRGGLSFTVDTIRAFTQRHSGAALFLLLGADAAVQLPSWRDVEGIRSMAEIVVVTRGTADAVASVAGAVPARTIATRRVDISSTELRARIRNGLSLAGFVPAAVAEYITSKGLYR